MKNSLNEKLASLFDEMIRIRRYLHKHPGLSYKEVKPPTYIADYHRLLGHEVLLQHLGWKTRKDNRFRC